MFLHEHGVPFEVVPGIPAAIAVPAYAGIPITYPGAGDTVTFVRGYGGRGPRTAQSRLETRSVGLGGTIICYTGARQLPGIIDALRSRGGAGDEPACLVYNGCQPEQETIQGTLDELARVAQRPRYRAPAILIVGRVAALREHLRWFDAKPLFGKRIVVTRPREQAADLVEQLEGLGAAVVEAPMIRIVPPEDFAPLDAACAEAGSFDWIVFTSVNGVDYFMRRLQAGPGDIRNLKGVRLCAIGPGTADRLVRHGISADLMPPEYRAEAVLDALRATADLAGKRVLLPRADIARELLAEELRKSGATVVEVVAYRSVPVEDDHDGGPDVYRMLLDKQIDVITFTSASAVRNFVRLYGKEQAADLLRTTTVAVIGPVTAEAAGQFGITAAVMPADYTIAGMVARLCGTGQKAKSPGQA